MVDITQGTTKDIPVHPLLKYLYENNATANAFSLKGYVGLSTKEGHVRVHADLDDLSDSVDIPKADILYFTEAPIQVLPLGGTVIWLKKDAQVIFNKVEASSVNAKVEPEGLEVNRGRLRIFIRGGLRSSVCQSRCQVCTSRCRVCTSRCSAAFGLPGGSAFPQIRER